MYDIVVGNMGDRNDLELWWGGSSMIEAVAAVNNNTIVVIHSVGPVRCALLFRAPSALVLITAAAWFGRAIPISQV